MFIKLFLIAIILYIIIKQFIDSNQDNNKLLLDDTTDNSSSVQIQPPQIMQNQQQSQMMQQYQVGQSTRTLKSENDVLKSESETPEYKIQEFERPYPWTKVIYINGEEYPYNFHIKIKIPSLNDFERWKQLIPNINFNPNTGELIIPSKDEASALALANLICINFSGQMTLQNILDKDLIRISITKAKSHEVVKNKLRDQIMEVLYGKSFNTVQTNYEKDLAKNGIKSVENKPVSLKSDNFRDTFEHFSDNKNNNEISAYDNSSYSYI